MYGGLRALHPHGAPLAVRFDCECSCFHISHSPQGKGGGNACCAASVDEKLIMKIIERGSGLANMCL
jgi:hypothetical protein